MLWTLLLFTLIHPYHRTLAEVEWNAQSNRYEVALRIDPRDLESALSDHYGRRVNLEHLDEAAAALAQADEDSAQQDSSDRESLVIATDREGEKLLAGYLHHVLQLSRRGGDAADSDAARATMHWVGYELDNRGKFLWAYFEWSPPPGEGSLWMENRLLMKTEPTHLSTWVFSDSRKRPALVFSRDKAEQRWIESEQSAAKQ